MNTGRVPLPPPKDPFEVFFSFHPRDNNDQWITKFRNEFEERMSKFSLPVRVSLNPHYDSHYRHSHRPIELDQIRRSNLFVPFLSQEYLGSSATYGALSYYRELDRRPTCMQVLLDERIRLVLPDSQAFRFSDQNGRFPLGTDSFALALHNFCSSASDDLSDDVQAGSERRGHVYQVWYATNRLRRHNEEDQISYSAKPDSLGTVSYGTCLVDIPETHEFGSIGKPWWKRWLRLGAPDDRLRLRAVTSFENEAQYFYEMNKELDQLSGSSRQVLIYLHGYNVTFEQAAVRAAQIGFDLKIKGITAFFSWPSCGTYLGYLADAERIGACETVIADFLTALPAHLETTDIHIIAHSMGNRGLARAFQRIVAKAESARRTRFAHIVLAAPDIEVSLFRDLATAYPLVSRRTTMYVSARDRALGLSRWIQDASRAGFTPPVTIVPNIDTVEVTNVDLTLLGHGYYAEADGVLRDIYDLIHFGAPPDERARTRSVHGTTGQYWVIGK